MSKLSFVQMGTFGRSHQKGYVSPCKHTSANSLLSLKDLVQANLRFLTCAKLCFSWWLRLLCASVIYD